MKKDTVPVDDGSSDNNLGVISQIAQAVTPELTPGVVRNAPNPDNLPLDAGRTFDFNPPMKEKSTD